MKILIAGGGSGGHIFPAFALAYELIQEDNKFDFIFVISKRDEERKIVHYVENKFPRFRVKISPLMPLRRKDLFAGIDFLVHLIWGAISSFFLVWLERPRVVIGFGGYLSGPLIAVAFLLGIPALLHEQNVYPGRANFILAHIANRIALSFEESKKYFRNKSKLVVTGNPLRPDLEFTDRKIAARELGFNLEAFTILVLGGSQGATVINKKIAGLLKDIKREGLNLQFIHVTGSKDFGWVKKIYQDLNLTARVFPLFEKMGTLYSCCDLVITRAGASTLNELSYFARPAIAIPYPYAGGHQLLNARYYSQRGALVVLEEKDLSSELLFKRIYEIMEDRERLNLLGRRIKEINSPLAARLLAGEVWSLIYVN